MQKRLTLTLDEELIRRAKEYAAIAGVSLSHLISEYFQLLISDKSAMKNSESPSSSSSRKVLKGNKSLESKIVSTIMQTMMSTDREVVKAKILEPGLPVYEADPFHPGNVIRIMPDGTRTSGRIKGGVFIHIRNRTSR